MDLRFLQKRKFSRHIVVLRGWQKNAALGAVSLCVAFLLAEFVVRLLWDPGGYQPVIRADPRYGWALRAGARLHSVHTDRALDYTIQINRLGMRDPERSPTKPRGVRRVLLLGDSMTFGPGVNAGLRFSDLLDARLGSSVEVLNAGVGGWGTDQEFLYLLHEGFDFGPDVVLLTLCMTNDVLNNMLAHQFLGTGPKPRFVLGTQGLVLEPAAPRPPPSTQQRVRTLVKTSRFLHYVGRHAKMLYAKLRPPPPHGPTAHWYPEDLESDASHWTVFKKAYSERFERAFQVTEALLAALADSCRQHQAVFLVFALPQKQEVDDAARHRELRHHGFEPEWFDLAKPYERLRRFAAARAIPFVYPLDEFRRAHRETPLFFPLDPHPNAAGHAVAAHCLEPVIRDALDVAVHSTRR